MLITESNRWRRAAVLALVFAAACVREEDQGNAITDDTCQTGLSWDGGDEESPLMHPGRDCIACHAVEDEGPAFLAAGTVYPDYREPDDCYGLDGITVELTGQDGAVLTAVTNAAGNFHFASQPLAVPFTARVLYEGRERRMLTPQTASDCASCHSAAGSNGAPGRIVAP